MLKQNSNAFIGGLSDGISTYAVRRIMGSPERSIVLLISVCAAEGEVLCRPDPPILPSLSFCVGGTTEAK